MEYYAAIQYNMLRYVSNDMGLKNIMLNERSHARKDYMLHDTIYIKSHKKAKV